MMEIGELKLQPQYANITVRATAPGSGDGTHRADGPQTFSAEGASPFVG